MEISSDSAPLVVEIVRSVNRKRSWDFLINNALLGTLSRESLLNNTSLVFAGEKKFSFCRKGFWKPYISVLREGQDYEYGRMQRKAFSRKWNYTNHKGNVFSLSSRGFASRLWVWEDSSGDALLKYEIRGVVKKKNSATYITNKLDSGDQLVLLFLGWYIILAARQARAAAAASN